MLTHNSNSQLSTLYTYRTDHKKYEDKNKLKLTHNSQLSTLYTYRTDHKKYEDKNKLNDNSQQSTFHVVHI